MGLWERDSGLQVPPVSPKALQKAVFESTATNNADKTYQECAAAEDVPQCAQAECSAFRVGV